ncbi:MAG: flagellar hook-basal body complex protein [Candidatus Brocadiae bacterium]|nr:flagellar hook-basal body complex protein [Candidatus Brocadiia bacterium]
MALIRAMNAAISGLRVQQTKIDAIGNNIANVNTTGYKSTSVDFGTLLSQIVGFGSAPTGTLGGVDPTQYGLGVQVSGTKQNFATGNFVATGVASDLAIDGDGFFIVTDGTGRELYTRDGTFGLNPGGLLIDPSTGFRVQGLMADLSTFTITPSSALTDITIPLGSLTIANATTKFGIDGNFNGGGPIASNGNVLQSSVPLFDIAGATPASLATLLTDLGRLETGGPLDFGLSTGDVLEFQAEKGGRSLGVRKFEISAGPPTAGIDDTGTTLRDLLDFIEGALGINTSLSSGTWGASIATGSIAALDTVTTTGAALTGDFVTAGVRPGDYIRFTSGPGAGQTAQIDTIAFAAGVTTLTFVSPLDGAVPLPLPGDTFEFNERSRVALGVAAATEDGTLSDAGPTPDLRVDEASPVGVMRISANAGLLNAIDNIVLSANGDRLLLFNESTAATGETATAHVTVFDSLGKPHDVVMTYMLEARRSPTTGDAVGTRLRWFAESADQIQSGTFGTTVGTGTIDLDATGKFVSENPGAAIDLSLDVQGVLTALAVDVDHAELTGLASTSSSIIVGTNDGFAEGTLNNYSVGADGVVTGIFSNGQTRSIAQVMLARFGNNQGLLQVGSNYYATGADSGLRTIVTPGTFSAGSVRGGFLEESNVDIAREFTDLIVAQRAFQANTRTISVANELLQDLVNLI